MPSFIDMRVSENSVTCFHQDKRREGFRLLEAGSTVPVQGNNLEAESFMTGEEEFISRDELLKRVLFRLAAGQHHAEWMLRLQERIPADLRGCYLVFPATRWEGPDGRIYLPVMSWDTDKQVWTLGFHWSTWVGWKGKGRVVVIYS